MIGAISNRLQNAKNERARMRAWGELLTFLEQNPDDPDANLLYDKFSRGRFSGRNWTKEVRTR